MRKLTYILIALLAISAGLNIYHYVYQVGYQRGFRAGMDNVSVMAAQQFKETGRLNITMDGKTVALVPERGSRSPMPEADLMIK